MRTGSPPFGFGCLEHFKRLVEFASAFASLPSRSGAETGAWSKNATQVSSTSGSQDGWPTEVRHPFSSTDGAISEGVPNDVKILSERRGRPYDPNHPKAIKVCRLKQYIQDALLIARTGSKDCASS